jgi:hypothetical protein
VLTSFLLSACYSSLPVASPVPERGRRIVARLTERASAEMAPLIGSGVVEVEGIVGETGENGWELFLLRVEQGRGQGALWNRERVVFPQGAFAAVTERRLAKTRTAMFAGVLAAAVILAGVAFGVSGFLPGGNEDGGTPPQ